MLERRRTSGATLGFRPESVGRARRRRSPLRVAVAPPRRAAGVGVRSHLSRRGLSASAGTQLTRADAAVGGSASAESTVKAFIARQPLTDEQKKGLGEIISFLGAANLRGEEINEAGLQLALENCFGEGWLPVAEARTLATALIGLSSGRKNPDMDKRLGKSLTSRSKACLKALGQGASKYDENYCVIGTAKLSPVARSAILGCCNTETRVRLLSHIALRGLNLRGIDLSNMDLTGADLSGADLRGADLKDTDLSGANLRDANLIGADLRDAGLRGADLQEANLDRARLEGTNLSGANLRGAGLCRVHLERANLSMASLVEVNLAEANLTDANLSGSDLSSAHLELAILRNANLNDANLSGTTLLDANFSGAQLERANLSGLKLFNMDLRGANLKGADLSGAVFQRSDLTDANLEGANLIGARFFRPNFTRANLRGADLSGTDLSSAKLSLDNLRHAKFVLDNHHGKLIHGPGGLSGHIERVSLYLATLLSEGKTISPRLVHSMNLLLYEAQESSDPAVQAAGKDLREQYIKMLPDEIKTVVEACDDICPEAPDEEPDYPYIFFAPDGQSFFAVEHNYMKRLILEQPAGVGDEVPEWSQIYYFEKPSGSESFTNVIPADMVAVFEPYPQIAAAYKKASKVVGFCKFITTLKLGEDYQKHFVAATEVANYTTKLVDVAGTEPPTHHQDALFDGFRDKVCIPGSEDPDAIAFTQEAALTLRLRGEHLAEILASFDYAGKSPREQAILLLSLSATFARYSSSHFFGTEGDSPIALRNYALALLNSAVALAPDLVPAEDLSEWRNKFAGVGNAFTCTAILSGKMIRYMKGNPGEFGACLNKILPIAWRR